MVLRVTTQVVRRLLVRSAFTYCWSWDQSLMQSSGVGSTNPESISQSMRLTKNVILRSSAFYAWVLCVWKGIPVLSLYAHTGIWTTGIKLITVLYHYECIPNIFD